MPCLIIGTSLAVFSSGLDQQVEILTSNETATPLVEVGILSKCAMPYNRHILAVSPQGCNRVNAASSLGKHLRGFQKR